MTSPATSGQTRPRNGPLREPARTPVAEIGFLAVDRNEWTRTGKNYVNGLFKMLHTEGSHPGLSDEDHSTFRLHVVLVTAQLFCLPMGARPSAWPFSPKTSCKPSLTP